MATVERERDSIPLPDDAGQEVDRLLRLAEDLDQRCRTAQRQIMFRWMTVATLALVVAAVVIVCWATPGRIEDRFDGWVRLSSLGVGGAYGFSMAYLALRTMMTHLDELRRDRRALYEIVGLLREVESAIAQRSNLSALERAGFRIRLSRFDVGPAPDRSSGR